MRAGWTAFDGHPDLEKPTEAFEAAPTIRWKHIDGPLLSWAGQLHWLTWRERFLIWIGRETAESIGQRYWPQRKKFASTTP